MDSDFADTRTSIDRLRERSEQIAARLAAAQQQEVTGSSAGSAVEARAAGGRLVAVSLGEGAGNLAHAELVDQVKDAAQRALSESNRIVAAAAGEFSA